MRRQTLVKNHKHAATAEHGGQAGIRTGSVHRDGGRTGSLARSNLRRARSEEEECQSHSIYAGPENANRNFAKAGLKLHHEESMGDMGEGTVGPKIGVTASFAQRRSREKDTNETMAKLKANLMNRKQQETEQQAVVTSATSKFIQKIRAVGRYLTGPMQVLNNLQASLS